MRDVDPTDREDDLAHAAGSTLVDFGERAGQSMFGGQLDLEDQDDEFAQDDEGLLDDEWWDEPEDDGSAAASSMRVLRIVAAVAAIGWLIALLMNFFGPSTLLDTTDGEQESAPVPPDDQAGIGGGLQVDQIAGDEAAQVLQVGEGDGPVVAGDATADGQLTSPDGAESSADGSPPAANGEATNPEATNGEAGNGGAVAPSGPSPDVPPTGGSGPPAGLPSGYSENLAMIQSSPARNTNHDASPHRATPQAELVLTNHYGPRSDYMGNPGGNPEQSFPVANGGQFRALCEFSHFAYDDPLVKPGQPGASHLHMFFGNTDTNAYTTYESLRDSGSSTCNGQELNRTGYWVPALFDDRGNVRVPERINVYYKGEGASRGVAQVYPPGAAMVVNDNYNQLPVAQGGIAGQKLTFVCSDNFSSNTGRGSQTMPNCAGTNPVGQGQWTVLEISVKFPTCWNGQDPSDWDNFRPSSAGGWYGNVCRGEFNQTLPNLEYFVNYPVAPGENTANWFLSSDVDPTSFGATMATRGSTSHGDWWGGWHPEVNQMWIDNCVNYRTNQPSGCGHGYLTDGGPNGNAPYDGPALQMRPQYTGPISVPAEQLFNDLCPDPARPYSQPADATYCRPG